MWVVLLALFAQPALSDFYCSDAVNANIQKNYAAGLLNLNATQFAAAYSKDATSEDPVGTPVAKGREAIAAGIQSLISLVTKIAVPVYNGPMCTVNGSSTNGAANWIIQFVGKNGCTVNTNGIDVFSFNPDGSIATLHAWWDGPSTMKRLDPSNPCPPTTN